MIATPAKPPPTPSPPAPTNTPPAPPLLRPLRALFLQELHEHWAYPAISLALWAALAFFLYEACRTGTLLGGLPNILGSETVQVLTLLTAAAVGLWIGVATALANRRFDAWAFLIHRPIPRSALFLARLLAGLTLYTLGIGIPFLLLLITAASPAGGLFFVWPMARPLISHFSLGILLYLAGFLVGDRHARLLGSRILPLLPAAVVLYATAVLPSFTTVLVLQAVAAALYLLAAWGSALSHGYQLPRAAPLPARLTLRLLLLIALALIAQLALIIAVRPILNRRVPLAIAIPSSSGYSATDAALLNTGQLIVIHFHSSAGATSRTLTDLDGNPVDPSLLTAQNWATGLPLNAHPAATDAPDFHDFMSWITPCATHDPTSDDAWYYIHPQGLAYGYNRTTHRFLGTLGQSGFAPPGAPPPTPFDERLAIPDHPFAFQNGVYDVSFDTRTVALRWTPPAGEHLLAIDIVAANQPTYRGGQPFTAYLTEHHLFIWLNDSPPLELPFDSQKPATLYHLADSKGWVLRYFAPRTETPTEYRQSSTYLFYNIAGRLENTQTLTTTSAAPPPNPDYQQLLHHRHIAAAALAGTLLPLNALAPALLPFPTSGPLTAPDWPALLEGLLPAALLIAALTYLLAKRIRAPHPLLWSLTALALGPAAPLTLLAILT